MRFCPSCKGLLVPAKEGWRCPSCGYTEGAAAEVKEEFKRAPPVGAPEQTEEVTIEAMPTVDAFCPKCGHDKALWYTKQTRAADEPETQFFICKKCGYRWRKY